MNGIEMSKVRDGFQKFREEHNTKAPDGDKIGSSGYWWIWEAAVEFAVKELAAEQQEQQEQNAKLTERLSRVADALGKAAVVIEELTRGCAIGSWETAAFAELSKAMAVVNSGLADDEPPACEACHGTGLAARAERVKEREDELEGGGV